jgi:hypothetical protein
VKVHTKKNVRRRRRVGQRIVPVNAEEELLLKRWNRRTLYFGVALAASAGSVFPFLLGYPLHEYWTPFGVGFTLLSGVLLTAFLYTAGTTFFFWWYSEKRWIRKGLL